jgi:sugar phosphate isomerase/epimerase
MSSRRRFLRDLATGVAGALLMPDCARAADRAEIASPLGGAIGLQLWSVRNSLSSDVPGTLARVRSLGIREVEGAGLAGMTARAFRAALGRADLVCRSAHVDYERLTDAPRTVIDEARTLGAAFVVCPWIPHDEHAPFTRDSALRAARVFNAFGRVAKLEGLRFAYHCHGYEFTPSAEGTLFDTLVQQTDSALVAFEIDLFWAKAGGADPARLVASLPGRVPLLHIKDMRRGLALPPASSSAPDDADVVAGTGQLDLPAILRAARSSRTEVYYIEDESPRPWDQIAMSLNYLANVRV